MKLMCFLIILFLVGCAWTLQAQNVFVKSFQALPMDMTTSSLEGKRIDQNGQVAALIKVMTSETGFVFEGGTLGIVDTQQRVGEIWVWVPRASRKITILHQKLGGLRDYRYPIEIEAARTYEMVLTTDKVLTTVEEEVRQQYLVFRMNPKDAVLEINDKPKEVSPDGIWQQFVDFGTYNYRVQAPNYYPDAGRVIVDDPINKVVVTVDLKPNYGWIEVNGATINDASVYIDNAFIGKVPCKSEILKSGEHTVKIVKELYEPFIERVVVRDNEITTLSPTLSANFANVTLKVDADAEIWVNEEKKGIRTWTGNLAFGSCHMECRMPGHESVSIIKQIDKTMEGRTITLSAPKPIYGSLNVESTPSFSKLYIDGKPFGETPNYISHILIGTHELKLTNEGFEDYIESFSVSKNERKQIVAMMKKMDDMKGKPMEKDNNTLTSKGGDDNKVKNGKRVSTSGRKSFRIRLTSSYGVLFASASIPMGDFADGNNIANMALGSVSSNDGGAGIGFNVGLKWNYSFGVPGLNVMLSLDGFYNGPSSAMKDYYTGIRHDLYSDDYHNYNVTVISPKYFNVPAMLGVHYYFDLNRQFGIYAEGGLGGNLRFITNYTVTVANSLLGLNGDNSDFQNAFSFAYQFGLGIKVNNSFVIGASIYDLGKADVKGEVRTVAAGVEAPAVSFENGSVRPMMILGRIGFAF